MAKLQTSNGQIIDTNDLPGDANNLIQRILDIDVILNPLSAEDDETDPQHFTEELQDYLRDSLRLKKNDEPSVNFLAKGQIGDVIYWIFESQPLPDHDLYLFAIRNDYVTEVMCVEKAVTFMEEESGDLHNRLMTPEQAVLLEYCTTDYQPPPRR